MYLFIPDIANLFIDDMGDVNGSAAVAAATATAGTPYMFSFFLFDMLLEFQFVVVALDRISLSSVLVRLYKQFSSRFNPRKQ